MALGAMSEASCQGAKSEMVLRRCRVDSVDMVLPHCGVSKHSQVPVTKEKNGEIVTVYEEMILSCPIQPGHTRALVCCRMWSWQAARVWTSWRILEVRLYRSHVATAAATSSIRT